MTKGASLQATAKEMTRDIADPFEREKAISTIRRDWGYRERWIDNVVRLRDPTFLAELTAGVQEASKYCWVEYAKTTNSNAKIGALRTIVMSKTRLALLLMKAGIIEQATQHIESTMTIAGMPFALDPEIKRALLAETERQREEKTNAQPGASGSRQE